MKVRIIQFFIILKHYICLLYVLLFKHKIENVWLISERGDEARDNGYAFFKYMKTYHPEQKVKYVISKDSPDYEKISKYKDSIIIYRSWKHHYYFINSKVLISTHIMGYSPDFRSMGKLIRKKLIFFRGKQVFLQHGIIKDDSPGLYAEKTNLDIFICGAKREYEYIRDNFHYNGQVKYTGLARYDYLESTFNNTILLMPTWRENLYHCSDVDFINTEYYKHYNSLINNDELNEFLKSKNFTLIFYPHYEIQKRIHLFKNNQSNIVIANSKEYSVPDLLKSTSLLITDFSSVYFDVAYMRKPVIYYHFDLEDYRKNHYKEGYFSYPNDGFGDIVYKEDDLVNKIKKYMNSDYAIEEKYEKRIKDFFVYRDKNNCKRIYEEILNLFK